MRAKPASGFTTPDDASIALRARPYRPEASFLLKTSASVFYVLCFFLFSSVGWSFCCKNDE